MEPDDSASADAARVSAVQWNDKNMTTHFANVVNVQSTREQVDLFFGMNHTWNPAQNGQVAVDLTNRIVMTPLAAKRLWTILGGVLREYESRHGALDVER
ncbi:DUF3467 domain-containing protein [uncultured Rhodoblastus sp.]|uniref:DUF3467 domain-containing protein n=1 Tax=uncultured Rhodoblastus sp. TaxID=543037 RepID=UPI0025E87C6B|nr:DUF3467 domain-containing protein [uncultured Rhodoblastus sp.]